MFEQSDVFFLQFGIVAVDSGFSRSIVSDLGAHLSAFPLGGLGFSGRFVALLNGAFSFARGALQLLSQLSYLSSRLCYNIRQTNSNFVCERYLKIVITLKLNLFGVKKNCSE